MSVAIDPSSAVARAAQGCTCHGLDVAAFDASIAAGATTVKACFRHHERLPKCGDCTLMIRARLAAAGATYGASVAPAASGCTVAESSSLVPPVSLPHHRPMATTSPQLQESLP